MTLGTTISSNTKDRRQPQYYRIMVLNIISSTHGRVT